MDEKIDIGSSLACIEMTGCLALALEPEGLGHLHGLASGVQYYGVFGVQRI